jgi:cell fate regulator YaaT (PSP1 superfamily)
VAARAEAVRVVFSDGGRVYSFDPAGLELAWNEKVICQTTHGHELGRVVQANHVLEAPPPAPLKKVVRRATEIDHERAAENRAEARRAMRVFRELLRATGTRVKPVAVEIVFDGSRAVVSYQADERPDLGRIQAELARRLHRRVELRSVGARECARLCGDHGLCGGKQCSRRFPSHEQPITLRMAKDQELSVTSGRITGLCGRLRCCLAFEHPLYKSFRDRAPRVGRLVETPKGRGYVTGYTVLADTCTVELEGGSRPVEIAIDDCREVAGESPRHRGRRV